MNTDFKFQETQTKYACVSSPDVYTDREEEMKQTSRRNGRNQSKRYVDRELLHLAKGINPEDVPKIRNEEDYTNFELDARDISDPSITSSLEGIKIPEKSSNYGSVHKKEYFGLPVREEWKGRSENVFSLDGTTSGYNINKTERAKCCDFIRRAQELTLKEIQMEHDENLIKEKQSEPKQVQNGDSFHMFKEKHIHSKAPQIFNGQKEPEENSEMHRQNENSKAKKWNFENSEDWLMHEPIPAYPPSKWTSPKDKMEDKIVVGDGLSLTKETEESIKGKFDGWKTLYERGLTNYMVEIPWTHFVDGAGDIYSKINNETIQDNQDELNVEKSWNKAKQLDKMEDKIVVGDGLSLTKETEESIKGKFDGWKTLYERGLTNNMVEIPWTHFVDGAGDIYSKINEKKIQDDQDELNVEKCWNKAKQLDKMEDKIVVGDGLSLTKETEESIKGKFDGWKTLYERGLTNYMAEIPWTHFVDGAGDINEKTVQDDQDELKIEKSWNKAKHLADDVIKGKLFEEEKKHRKKIIDKVAGQSDKVDRQDVGEKHYIKEPGDYFKFSDAFKELPQTMKEIKENKTEFENENTFQNWIINHDMKTKKEKHYEEKQKKKESDNNNEEKLMNSYIKFKELASNVNLKKMPSFEEWRNCVTSHRIEENVANFKKEIMCNLPLSELKISGMKISKDHIRDYTKFIKTIREVDQEVKEKQTEPKIETKMDDYNQIVAAIDRLKQKLKETKRKEKQPEHLNDFSCLSEEEKRAVEFRKDYDKDFKERRAWLDQQIKDNSARQLYKESLNAEGKRNLLTSMNKTDFEQIKCDTKRFNNSEIKYTIDSGAAKCRMEMQKAKSYKDTCEAKCNKEMINIKPCVYPSLENLKNKNLKECSYIEKRNGIMTHSIMDRISGYFERRLAELLAGDNEKEPLTNSEKTKQKKSHVDTVMLDWRSPDIKVKMCY